MNMDVSTPQAQESFINEDEDELAVLGFGLRNRRVDFLLEFWKYKSTVEDLCTEFEKIIVIYTAVIQPTLNKLILRDVVLNPWTLADVQELEQNARRFRVQYKPYELLEIKLYKYCLKAERRVQRLQKELSRYDNQVESWNKIMDPELNRMIVERCIIGLYGIVITGQKTFERVAGLLSDYTSVFKLLTKYHTSWNQKSESSNEANSIDVDVSSDGWTSGISDDDTLATINNYTDRKRKHPQGNAIDQVPAKKRKIQ